MAAGQLAGGLAWLAISGEDAPDLVATAPVPASFIIGAKIEAVLGVIAIIFAPLVAALAVASPRHALVTGGGIVIAAAAATAIQLWFRTQAKRSQFRRRQVFLPLGHLRGGLFLDRAGGRGGGRRRQRLARHRSGSAGAHGAGRRLVRQPAHARRAVIERRQRHAVATASTR